MPLTEYETRMLEAMERQLEAEDPKLASKLSVKEPSAWAKWREARRAARKIRTGSVMDKFEERWSRRAGESNGWRA